MHARRRKAFTIVELLVVITIIGILMALLFPAIQAARESARRAECLNNQRQVGQAVLNYATSKNNFPKHMALGTSSNEAMPWPVVILNRLGRSDIYDLVWDTTGVTAVGTQRVDIFICPSDPPPMPDAPSISYVANSGPPAVTDEDRNIGVMMREDEVSLGFIASHDGTSTTLMLSENVNATTWSNNSDKFQTAIVWPAITSFTEELTAGADAAHARPSSRHSGGVIVTFCDGHAQFINNEVFLAALDPTDTGTPPQVTVYDAIMTPNGRKATPAQNLPLSDAQLDK